MISSRYSLLRKPKPRVIRPAVSYPKMNDEIQIELEPKNDGRSIRVKSGILKLTDRQLRLFWKKVTKQETGCWLWNAATSEFGHGSFGIKTGRSTYAHRVSYQIHHGPISLSICVLHNCPGGDNPRCVNPAHLWLGTRADNNRDCRRKGRARHPSFKKDPLRCVRGERIHTSKLTSKTVIEIREKYSTGNFLQSDLAKEFNVSNAAISAIITKRNWKIT